MNTREIAIAIINHLNSEFNLELKTIDASAMTDDVKNILEQALQQTDVVRGEKFIRCIDCVYAACEMHKECIKTKTNNS